MTIAEMTASGTPAIYIPFPHSAGGHQDKNARVLEREGGGWYWPEDWLEDPEARTRNLEKILEDRDNLFAVAGTAWAVSPAVSADDWLRALEKG